MILALLIAAAPLEICAASSFTDVAPKLAPKATFRFESSAKISKLVEAGARCDVVLLADEVWAQWLFDKKLVRAWDVFASNTLVVVARDDRFKTPSDLPKAKRLALAGEAVPAARYAKAALEHHQVYDEKQIVRADNVRVALSWVARGEADAGIVYVTDARVEPKVKVAFEFAKTAHPKIALTAAARSDEGQAFVAFLKTDAAQEILRSAGFSAADTSR